MRDEVRGPGGGRARWVAAAQAVCTGRARLKAGGHRARAGRTWNMPSNTVTLDVSRLSGWLNATALCRVERRACDAERGAGRKATGRGAAAAQAACTGRARLKGRARATARAERTQNMLPMFVTLDVSKLSGWLNADATCRAERRAYDAERGVGRKAGGWAGGSARAACMGRGPGCGGLGG